LLSFEPIYDWQSRAIYSCQTRPSLTTFAPGPNKTKRPSDVILKQFLNLRPARCKNPKFLLASISRATATIAKDLTSIFHFVLFHSHRKYYGHKIAEGRLGAAQLPCCDVVQNSLITVDGAHYLRHQNISKLVIRPPHETTDK
jgi:hypothetical protein